MQKYDSILIKYLERLCKGIVIICRNSVAKVSFCVASPLRLMTLMCIEIKSLLKKMY